MQYPSYVFAETLRDGTAVTVRAAGANDGPKIRRSDVHVVWSANRAGPLRRLLRLLQRRGHDLRHRLFLHVEQLEYALRTRKHGGAVPGPKSAAGNSGRIIAELTWRSKLSSVQVRTLTSSNRWSQPDARG